MKDEGIRCERGARRIGKGRGGEEQERSAKKK